MHPSSSPRIFVRSNRVLVIDDNPSIHEDVRKVLCPPVTNTATSLNALEDELFGETEGKSTGKAKHSVPVFTVDSAHQGREGLALVQKALAEGKPYGMAFVDMRMPPGWDGVETTLELWKV